MSLHKLTAGDGYTYLTRQVAAADATERGYKSLGDYYTAKGESPGTWAGLGLDGLRAAGPAGVVTGVVTEQQMKNLFGAGLHPNADQITEHLVAAGFSRPAAVAAGRLGSPFYAMQLRSAWRDTLADGYRQFAIDHHLTCGADRLTDQDRETVRTQVADRLFHEAHGRLPSGAAERTGFIAQQSRPDRTAIAGYDLTFSPVKSVSTLWAIAPRTTADKIEAAHHAAVGSTLAWIEKEAGYTRLGPRGVAQVPTRGLIMAMFTHRDSRAGDPDLHTHVAVSNKVQTLDGRWLALDARMLYRVTVGASEFYNTQLEAEITTRLGVTFADQPTEPGKRPVREIVGINPTLLQRWSSRRAAITTHRTALAHTFLTRHGRIPTTIEMIKLAQQATLATRQHKHEPRSHAEQRRTWTHEATHTLGGQPNLDRMLAAVQRRGPRPGPVEVTNQLINDLAAKVIAVVSESRATWRQTNLDAEAHRQVRHLNLGSGELIDLAATIATRAVGSEHSIPIGANTEVSTPVPAELTRPDGTSVFRMAKGQLFTATRIIDAERRILAAAGRTEARTLTAAEVKIAHLEWSANHHGAVLNTAQETMVTDIATTDRVLQLALAPAGTGKTTVMGVLARGWMSSGGNVLGLAPQASAARELAAAIPGVEADTIDKLAYDLTHLPTHQWQPWMTQINADSLVIVDEAGLASTPKLDTVIRFVTDRGGRVLLVGDDQQRAATGAGGVLRNIETIYGAATLTEVLRFTDPVDAHASLALRAGDPGVVGYYTDRQRLIAVTPDTAAHTAFQGWATDIAAGKESIMIAPTLDMVRDLNTQARSLRLTTTTATDEIGSELMLPNGETISAGDTIITKQNKRTLPLGGTDFVRNNQRWTVNAVHDDGSITASEAARGTTRTLPAWYINKGWVRLGYAHTHASVQGMTIGKAGTRPGTAHAIVTAGMSRNDLYPALTRAVDGTTAYLVIGGDGDPHDMVTPDAIQPATAAETFQRIITTDGTPASVTTEQQHAADPARRLGSAADAYAHTIVTACETLVGTAQVEDITTRAELAVPGITDGPAWDVLRAHLVVIAADGRDPVAELTSAAHRRDLTTARDLAAVLDFRLDPTGNHSQGSGPLPWLPRPPRPVVQHPRWADYITARADLVEDLVTQVRATARAWDAGTAPRWTIPYLTDPNLVTDLAVWRAAESIPDDDLRPAGPKPRRIAMIQRHTELVDRAVRVGGDPTDNHDRWAAALGAHAAVVTADDYWPVLSGRLALADTAGVNVHHLLRTALGNPPPLPAEGAAGALWWRLTPHIGATTATSTGNSQRLRPHWTSALHQALGDHTAERITNDRLWPIIVAHVDAAARTGADATRLVTDAATMLNAHPANLAEHDLPAVLLINLAQLADYAMVDENDEAPPDPQDADLHAPDGAFEMTPIAETGSPQTTSDPQRRPHSSPAGDLDSTEIVSVALSRTTPAVAGEPAAATVMTIEPSPPLSGAWDAAASTPISRIYAALEAAHSFYTERAPNSWVPAYMTSRRLDPLAAGYAPGRNALVHKLHSSGFTDTEMLAAGLARTNTTHGPVGGIHDLFNNRLTLPCTDPAGRIVGFIARKTPTDVDHHHPKYINSPETLAFHKRALPIGLDRTSIAALQQGADVVIVEGPMDAMAINTASSRQGLVAVATAGTSLTADQLGTLNRIAPLADRQVVLLMDQDAAGTSAAARSYRTLTTAGVTEPLTLVSLPTKDAAQLLQERGPEALQAAVSQRVPLADLVVDDVISRWPNPQNWIEPRINALKEVAPIVRTLPDEQQQRQALRISNQLNLPLLTVLENVDRLRPPTANATLGSPHAGLDLPVPPAAFVQRNHDTALRTQHMVIESLRQHPEAGS